MPMYNLLEYSKNYRKRTRGLLNYYRDKPSNPLSSNSESFKCKTSITGNTYNFDERTTDTGGNEINNSDFDATKFSKNETEVVILLKHLINLWRV